MFRIWHITLLGCVCLLIVGLAVAGLVSWQRKKRRP